MSVEQGRATCREGQFGGELERLVAAGPKVHDAFGASVAV